MTVAQVSELLHNHLHNGQLELTADTIAQVPLGGLLTLLQASGLVFQNAVIATPENGVALTGTVALLGADAVELEALFEEADSAVKLRLSAKHLPTIAVPGAAWLQMKDAQLVVQVAGTQAITGTISGTVSMAGRDIQTVLLIDKVGSELVLQWTITDLDLNAITSVFLDGAALPPELPNLVFHTIDTQINPKSRTFSFAASTQAPLNFPAGNGLSITETHVAVSRQVGEDGTSQLQSAIVIKGATPLAIAPDLSLEQAELTFELKGKDWSISGAVAARVLESVLTLNATYAQTATTKKLTLAAIANPAITVARLETGHLDFAGLTLEFDQASPTESAWRVAGTGAIVVQDVLDAAGTITLAKTTDGTTSFVMTPDPAHASAHLLLPPDQHSSLNLGFGEISIIRHQTATGSTITFAAEVDLAFKGLHPTAQKLLPDVTKTIFKADASGVTLTIDRLLAPVDLAIPDIDINDAKISLGAASIDISNFSVQLGKTIEIAAELGIGLPSKLNNLFGVNADGTAKIEFFNTFNPTDRDHTVVKTRLTIGSAGIKLVPTGSMIKAIEIKVEKDANGNTASFWYCTLGPDGEFGQVKFKVPEFSYDAETTSFKASGGFETIKPLALPLTPAKLLLSACKLTGAAAALPDSLPLQGVEIVDAQGNFRVEELIAVMGSVGANLPADVKAGLKVIGDRLDHLPDDFKQYLNIEIPQSFNFDIAVTPEGTVRFDARVKDGDPPIKLLTAGMLGGLPVLNGISLRGISFGELSGGSLFLLQVDATVDQFDLVTLATSLALPDIANNPLPSTKTLHRRLILDKLFMLILYQTVIPIPIPLFYDEIGIEYLGLEGLQLGLHGQFPMPSFNLAEMGQVIANLKQFFTDRDFLFPAPPNEPKNINLKFALEKTFLKLPSYLGGKSLGAVDNRVAIDIFQVMNGLKTLSVNALVQALPLTARVGSESVNFGPIALNAGWLITTPGEFQQIARQAALNPVIAPLQLASSAQATELLSVLPQPDGQTHPEQGLIVFLRGGWNVPNVTTFQTTFALAASDLQGFKTGFKLAGNISDVMALTLAGAVQIDGKSNPAFRLAGQSRLTLAGQTVFQGDVQMTSDRFQCQGKLDIFGVGGAVAMTIDRTTGAVIQGALNPIDLTVFKLNQASMLLKIQAQQAPVLNVRAAVELLGLRNQTDVTISDQGFSFTTTGTLFNAFSGTIQASGTRVNSTANFHITATLGSDPNAQQRTALQQAAAAIRNEIATLQAQINQFRNLPASIANAQIAALTSVISSLNQQLASVNLALSAITPPSSTADPHDFTQTLRHEITQTLNQAIAKAKADLSIPQQKVDSAQVEVNRLNAVVAQQRNIVNGERASANQRLQSAKDDVNAKQREVDRLQGEINRRRQRIADLTPGDICINWPTGRTCTPGIPSPSASAEITKLGLEIVGLGTAFGTATVGLKTAQGVLDLTQKTVVQTPIDADPRVFGPLGALKTATEALNLAKQTLEGLKTVSRVTLQAADFIANRGLDALLIVQSARFEADINTAATGQVMLSVQLSYMDKPTTFAANFNFKDGNAVKAMGQAIAQKLLNP